MNSLDSPFGFARRCYACGGSSVRVIEHASGLGRHAYACAKCYDRVVDMLGLGYTPVVVPDTPVLDPKLAVAEAERIIREAWSRNNGASPFPE